MANISDKTEQIRKATHGKDVRESLASGIEAINAEVINTTGRQDAIDRNESGRISAENARVQAENSRETKEALRQSTFETNEANRTNTFNANEQTRNTNEQNRVQAETQRVSEFQQIKSDYNTASKYNVVTYDDWVYTASEDTTEFTILMGIFNPVLDIAELSQGGVLLSEGTNYTRLGSDITLGYTLNAGESINIRVFKGVINEPPSADGSNMMNGSITKMKLSADVADVVDKAVTAIDFTDETVTVDNDIHPLVKAEFDRVDSELNDIALTILNFPKVIPESDDTSRFKRLLSVSNKRTVLLEFLGVYDISDTLIPLANSEIEGSFSTINNNINSKKPLFSLTYSNQKLRNFKIKNNYSDVGVTTSDGSYTASPICIGFRTNINELKNFEIENILIEGGILNTSAIIAIGNVKNVYIKNCLIDGNFITSYHAEWNGTTVFSPKNVQFQNCKAINNQHDSSYAFYCSGNSSVKFKNCDTDNVINTLYWYTGDSGIESGRESICIVEDCNFVNFSAYGVSVRGTDATNSIYRYTGFIMQNCNIVGASNGSTSITQAIRLYRNNGGISIKNNKIRKVNIGVNTDPCYSVLLEHNEFDDIYNQAINTVQFQKGFITKNIFKDVSKSGNASATDSCIVLTFLSNDNIIEDNIFGYEGQTVLPRFHIYIKQETTISNSPNNNKIYGNTFYTTAGGYSIVNGSTSGNFVLNNYVDDNVVIGSDIMVTGACVLSSKGGMKTWYHNTTPTTGTHKVGDKIINNAPTLVRNISHWECITGNSSGGVWVAHGCGIGTTAQRPVLTANDQGYMFRDTTTGTIIIWNGSAWI
jgi:hypothetical protein